MATGALAIDVRHVSKTYRTMRSAIPALVDVSLGVHAGEVFGLLGPNGAGKSTLVKVLMTVIRASKVEGSMLGAPVGHKPTLARVGYLPEHHKFPEYLRAHQVLHLFGALSGIDRRTRNARAGKLLDMVGLGSVGTRTVRQFSKGMRQRLGLAQALINEPQVLLLDEPTDGVDPEGRRDIRVLLGRLREEGRAVLVNSHILAELELIVDRAAIIHKGKLEAHGTIGELTRYDERYEVEADLPPDVEASRVLSAAGIFAGEATELKAAGARRVVMSVRGNEAEPVQGVIDSVRAVRGTVRRVQLMRPSLEQAFISVIEKAETRRRGEAAKAS